MISSFDTILRNANVIDGSGQPAYTADIGLLKDRIAAIGNLDDATATQQDINLEGLSVVPGFIDVHTHDDRALLSNPDMLPKLTQGVTTVVTGNCGISLAPLSPNIAIVPPLDLVATEEWLRFPHFADYLDALDAAAPAVNVVALVGHTSLRAQTMTDLSLPASQQEISQMQQLLDEALQSGAWGMSTGTFYPPAAAAPTEEIIEVGQPLGRHKGLYATHMRNEADRVMESLEETFVIGKELGINVVISHHKLAGVRYHGMSGKTLQRIKDAMAEQPVCLDCYPYNASSTMLHPDFIERASSVMVAWSTPHPKYAGRMLADIAAELGCDQREAANLLMPAGAIYFLMDENDVQAILAFDETMIGSDGLPHDNHPHPRLWGLFLECWDTMRAM
ncbi:N-acyl-D-amino-acid deacylase family protein [Paenalcaligenes niemegkensis]|uniref:N-acyl-D-amino-acid deacylase family protein n=1 Tax=Paenalcaligenes niemegkensis TaxID=2895469 RepID=UPI0027E27853|nr:amidohydrolase family protein [Paenalcaligenes niemegkensis]